VFPWLLAAGLVAAIALFRVAISAGFGFDVEPGADGQFRTGILVNLPDNLSYASWAQQSRSFAPAMSDLYTTQAHTPLMFSAFLALLGFVAGATELPVQGWMNVFGLAGVLLTVVATYRLAREGGMDAIAARASVGMLCFASGLSAVVVVLQRVGLDLPLGADARYLEAFRFTAFFGYPYQTFALGCLYATALALLRAEIAADAGTSVRRVSPGSRSCCGEQVHRASRFRSPAAMRRRRRSRSSAGAARDSRGTGRCGRCSSPPRRWGSPTTSGSRVSRCGRTSRRHRSRCAALACTG
jgi:hypothetical protein